jgi:hypothetical protein
MRNTLKITTLKITALAFAFGMSMVGASMAATHDSDIDQTSGGAAASNIAAPTYGVQGAVTGAAHMNGSNRDGTGVTPPAAERYKAQHDRTASADSAKPASN